MGKTENEVLATLLARWRREVAHLPAEAVASSLGVAASALSNWETGKRRPSGTVIRMLDERYGAGGTLADLAWALTTPRALEPMRTWWHNFVPGGGPVWAWIRPAGSEASCNARIRWGPLGVAVRQAWDERGLVVTLPISVSTPPAVVELGRPGWVDFGRGPVPGALGLPLVDAAPRLQVFYPADHSLHLVANSFRHLSSQPIGLLLARHPLLAESLGRLTGTDAGGLERPDADAPDHLALSRPERPGTVTPANSGFRRNRLRRLREARGLSQAEAAAASTALLPAAPVTDDQVGLLEAGGSPRPALLEARLDVVYGARGTVTSHQLLARLGPRGHEVEIPPWWDGPIWVRFTCASREMHTRVSLHRPPWLRQLDVENGTTVAFRHTPGNPDPLGICVPSRWHPLVGLGAVAEARGVDDGWQPESLAARTRILRRYLPLYLQVLGLHPGQLLGRPVARTAPQEPEGGLSQGEP